VRNIFYPGERLGAGGCPFTSHSGCGTTGLLGAGAGEFGLGDVAIDALLCFVVNNIPETAFISRGLLAKLAKRWLNGVAMKKS
jgi:hypothetical protein